MLKVKTQQRHRTTTLRLFRKVTKIADELENILEDGANYRPEFLKSLQASLKQVKAGKVKKLVSLSDL